ncbi:MAG: adenosylcobalamin-dependent ribonucleoside-diphosphate reductase [Gammaproteobacteria bacterium]|nr:adenosylcobalamin-dependent ribonucleoside-diphosphate reductase [Gammaproteobacteria bacterium]
MTFLTDPLSTQIWDIKYRYRLSGKIIDNTIEQTWSRVAKAVARAEKPTERAKWQKAFFDLLAGFRFLPGGRILAGAGTQLKVTLFNCFVMNIAEDSLPGIFDALEEGALTLQEGGGVGYDFSVLRPRGELVKKTGIASSGPVSFMKIWNTTCGILLSTGARRGAMMAVMRCDHPDIEEFITAKSDPNELRHFNVSVLVSDAFMQAVKADLDWELIFPIAKGDKGADDEIVERPMGPEGALVSVRIYRRIKARALWLRIIKNAYDYAEPGVLFEDTINKLNTLWYREKISATNPCGEIPLPPYGACNLGSINLTQFVLNPFTPHAEMDWEGIERTSQVATRFLDNVIDVSRYPLKQQQKQAKGTRRIGLGVTGLADALVMMGLRYGSNASQALASRLMKLISETTWMTSAALAEEKGSFPFFEAEAYLKGDFVKRLPAVIRDKIAVSGMRNSHHNTIAPTGTISLLANNVSSGIEPIFSDSYDRYVILPDGTRQLFSVTDYVVNLWRAIKSPDKLPPAWVDSKALTPEDHLLMQYALQPYIDNAISKTINLPEDFPFEKLEGIYTNAHELGLKGCTVFRPNPITGSVLEVTTPEEDVERCCQLS